MKSRSEMDGPQVFSDHPSVVSFQPAFDKSWAKTGGRMGSGGSGGWRGSSSGWQLAEPHTLDAPRTWSPFGEIESRCASLDAGSRHPATEVGRGRPCREGSDNPSVLFPATVNEIIFYKLGISPLV